MSHAEISELAAAPAVEHPSRRRSNLKQRHFNQRLAFTLLWLGGALVGGCFVGCSRVCTCQWL